MATESAIHRVFTGCLTCASTVLGDVLVNKAKTFAMTEDEF